MRTYFDVLGIERSYRLDPVELERRYHQLSKELHPDRHATKSPHERLLSVQMTTELNHAFRTLRDDVKRAEYLLSLEGIDVAEEKPAPLGAAAETKPMVVSANLLMEMMELREALAEARAARDEVPISVLAEQVKGKRSEALAVVEQGFRGFFQEGERAHLKQIAAALISLRYYARFLDEVEAHHEERERS